MHSAYARGNAVMTTKTEIKVRLKRTQVIDLLRIRPMMLSEMHANLKFSHTKLRVIVNYLIARDVIKATAVTERRFLFSLLPESSWGCAPESVKPRRVRPRKSRSKEPSPAITWDPQGRVVCYGGLWGLS